MCVVCALSRAHRLRETIYSLVESLECVWRSISGFVYIYTTMVVPLNLAKIVALVE